ncbi:MAG: hypothetical protein ACO3JL_02545, partial [Myxococcota bacterium]
MGTVLWLVGCGGAPSGESPQLQTAVPQEVLLRLDEGPEGLPLDGLVALDDRILLHEWVPLGNGWWRVRYHDEESPHAVARVAG